MNRFFVIAIMGLLFLTACNDAKKPNSANFTKAINLYLAKHGNACTAIVRQFPIDIPLSEQREPYGIGPKLATLEQAGLVHGSETTAVVHRIFEPLQGPTPPYEFTPEGMKYFLEIPGPLGQTGEFCYGHKTVNTIVKWTEPMTTGALSQSEVT